MTVTVLHARKAGAPPLNLSETLRVDVTVQTVHSQTEAFDSIVGDSFDCVIIEHELDRGDGLDLLSALRAERPALPVIFCTEEPDGSVASEATRYDIDAYHVHSGEESLAQRLGTILRADSPDQQPIVSDGASITDTIRDVSENRSQADLLKQLHEIASDTSLSHEERIRKALDEHRERLGVSLGFVGRMQEGRETLVVTAGDHDLAVDGTEIPVEDTYCQFAMEAEEPLILEDVEETGIIPTDILDRHGLHCYFGETIVVDGENWGTLCFAGDSPAEQEFDEVDVAFLELLADWVGYELTQKHQQEELYQERERVRQILERIDDAFFALDTDWNVTYFNSRAEEVLQMSREEVIGNNVWELFSEALNSTFEKRYRHAMERQEPVTFEEYYSPLETWFEVSAYPSEDGLSVYFTDITERKQYADALAAMHEQTNSLMAATTPEEIAEIAVETTEKVLGYELCAIRLYEDEELRPVRLSDEVHDTYGERPAYAPGVWGPGEAFASGETVHIENVQERARSEAGGPSIDAVEGVDAGLYIPIEQFGVLSVASTDGEFSETDRSLAELFASHAAMAFERVERERELRTSQTVLETLQGMVYALDTAGEFGLINDALIQWLGYDRAELVAAGPDAMFSGEQRERFWQAVDGLKRGETDTTTVELTMTGKDEKELPAEIELALAPADAAFSGVIGVVTDRSALEAARKQLETERSRFQYLFNNLPDAVSEVRFEDGEPVVMTVNEAFEETFGYSEAEIADYSLDELIVPPGARNESEQVNRKTAAGELWSGELRRLTVDGRRDFLFRGVPYRDGTETDRGFGIYTDITERKHSERRLQVLTRVIRHNLRNELTVLLGYSEMLDEQLETEPLSTAAGSLYEGVENVIDLSENAREIQKTLDETVEGSPQRFDAVLSEIVREYETINPDLEVELDVPPSLSVLVDGRLRLALKHLIENAVEHGGTDPRVRIGARTAAGNGAVAEQLVITVEDNGPGIPEIEWGVVAGQTEITQLSHGSGLGLWAIKWVTESYGGELEQVESELGGAGVRLSLPGLVASEE